MSLWLLVTLLATAGPTQSAAPSAPAASASVAPASAVDSLGILGPPAPAQGRDPFAGFS